MDPGGHGEAEDGDYDVEGERTVSTYYPAAAYLRQRHHGCMTIGRRRGCQLWRWRSTEMARTDGTTEVKAEEKKMGKKKNRDRHARGLFNSIP